MYLPLGQNGVLYENVPLVDTLFSFGIFRIILWNNANFTQWLISLIFNQWQYGG